LDKKPDGRREEYSSVVGLEDITISTATAFSHSGRKEDEETWRLQAVDSRFAA
jgi:hypothetical protein